MQMRRFDASYNPNLLKILKDGTGKDDKNFEKICVKRRRANQNIQQPLYGTLMADLMPRQDEGRFILGKY